ncbi:hypothetical protein EG832_21695 [bacterium]|nr:hypothetical protein [bacterium]
MRNLLLAIFAAILLLSSGEIAESKDQWTDKQTIEFAEDLFFLVETVTEEVGPVSKVYLDSYEIQGGTVRIMEFRFPNDRIVQIEVHRNVAGEDNTWLKTISIFDSFFEKMY